MIIPSVPESPKQGAFVQPGVWFITVPEYRRNLVNNPSAELSLNNLSGFGGSTLARVIDHSRFGAYSVRVTAGTTGHGLIYGTTTGLFTFIATWAASCWLLGSPGHQYALAITDTSNNPVTETVVTGTGRWQYLSLVRREVDDSLTRRLLVRCLTPSSPPFFVDGLQFERCDTLPGSSTYIDGDQFSPTTSQEYFWEGTPHESISHRLETCRTGGVLVDLTSLGLTVLSQVGLDTPVYQHRLSDKSSLPGAHYSSTSLKPRSFSLVCRLHGGSTVELQRLKHRLINLLAPGDWRDAWCRLVFEPRGAQGEVVGDRIEIFCLYAGGLEGNQSNPVSETVTLQFIQPDPRFKTGSQGLFRSASTFTVSNLGFFYNFNLDRKRLALEGFPPSGGPNGSVLKIRWDEFDQSLVLGGSFNSVGGAPIRALVRLPLQVGSFTAIGSGTHFPAGGYINDLLCLPNGDIIVVGNFLDAGGSANRDHIAYYQRSTNSWIDATSGTPFNGEITSVAWDGLRGTFFVGGVFTQPVPYLAQFQLGSPPAPVGTTSPNGAVVSVYFDGKNDRLYASGEVTNIFTRIGWYDFDVVPSGWNQMGSGFDSPLEWANDFHELPSGNLLVLGTFADAGGVPNTRGAAVWNGYQWQAISDALDGGGPIRFGGGRQAHQVDNGMIVVAGNSRVGYGRCRSHPSRVGWIQGSSWVPFGIVEDMSANLDVTTVCARPGGRVFIGRTYNIPGSMPNRATFTYFGTSPTFPVFRLTVGGWTFGLAYEAWPCLYYIRNLRTGETLYFDDFTLRDETVIIDFRQGLPRVISSRRGDQSDKILSGSLVTIVPGENTIEVLAREISGFPVTWTAWWSIEHSHLGGAIWQ